MKRKLRMYFREVLLLAVVLLSTTWTSAQCFEPLYADETNLIEDPEITDAAKFAGWGTKGLNDNTDTAFVYCGNTSGFAGNGLGVSSGSLDYVLTGKLQANTAYRVHAYTYVPEGDMQIGFWNTGAPVFEKRTTKSGQWEEMDFVVVPNNNLNVNDHGIYFNNWQRSGTIGYIDNWELYAVPNYEAGLYAISLTTGALDKAFDIDTLTYTATVPFGTASVTPSVVSIDPAATVTGLEAVDLSSGSGSSTFEVTARDGVTKKTYTVTYAWASEAALSGLSVDKGELVPAFSAGVSEYKVYAPLGATSVTLTAVPASESFTVAGAGVVDISAGKATATIEVSGDGYGTKTYTVEIIGVQKKHAYTFDTDATDGVGSVNGTLNGNAKIENGALVTSADGDYLSFDGAALNLSAYDAITMEAFVIAGDATNPGWTMLTYFGDSQSANAFYTSIARNDNVSRAEYLGAAVNGPELEDGKYHHIVSVLTENFINFYIDGELIGKTERSGPITIGTTHSYLAESGWPDPTWNGSFLEFNIYNGVMDAASVAERASLLDNDGDGIANDFDNCPDVANPNQRDTDGDGIGDVCDSDSNAANLSSLILDKGMLIPNFDPFQYEYLVYAPFGVTSVEITAVPESNDYTVTGAGTIDISSGAATATIQVTGTGKDATTYTVEIVALVLKHSYTFEDGTANDAAGELNATLSGNSIAVANGVVTVSGAASNTDGFMSLDAAALALNTYKAISLEMFIQSEAEANGNAFTMLAYFGNNNGGDRTLWYQPTRGNNEIQSRAEANNAQSTFTASLNDVELDDGKYHHVVVILSNDSLQYYLDGELVSSVAITGEFVSNIDNQIAHFFKGPDQWADPNYNGSLEEINIYNGVMDAAAVSARAFKFDPDKDGVTNGLDDDDDGDGQLDVYEIQCGSDPLDASSKSPDENSNGIPDCMEADDDEDGVANYEDNCPTTANADQADMDEDGIGDVCDDDRDGDGISNDEDTCPDDANIGDADGDGIDDACDELSASNSLAGDLSFGEVGVGSSSVKSFTIVNSGTDALSVTSITAPADFTVDQTTATVNGGAFVTVRVTFAPTAVQAYTGNITVESAAGTATLAVSGSGIQGVLAIAPEGSNIKFGPNPIENSLLVNWSAAELKAPAIMIYDMNGKVHWQGSSVSGTEVRIDLSGLEKGMYLMKVISENQTEVIKLLKQ